MRRNEKSSFDDDDAMGSANSNESKSTTRFSAYEVHKERVMAVGSDDAEVVGYFSLLESQFPEANSACVYAHKVVL